MKTPKCPECRREMRFVLHEWTCECGSHKERYEGMTENEIQYRMTGTYNPHDPLIEYDELGFPRWGYPTDPSEI